MPKGEAIKCQSDAFQTFVSQNRPALKVAGFSDDEIKLMDNIARDLQQSNRSLNAVRIPGQSNTAQDIIAGHVMQQPGNLLRVLATAMAAGGLGWLAGPLGLGAAGAGVGLEVLRARGLDRIDALVREALLDPPTARLLLMRVKPKEVKPALMTFTKRLRRSAVAGVLSTEGANP